MSHTPSIYLAAFVAVSTTLSVPSMAAEPFIPERPKQLDEVVRVGAEVERMLDGMPPAGSSDSPADDSSVGPPRGRTTAGWVLVLVFSVVGLSFFIYGKKQVKPVILVCGILLMGFPYLVTDAILMAIIGVSLCAAPWTLRRLRVAS